MRGSDLWLHIASGQWIVQSLSFIQTDSWSFTRDGQPWMYHEWLSAVLYYLWMKVFGLYSLAYWKWGMIVVSFVTLFKTVERGSRDSLTSFVGVLFGLAVCEPFLDIRPHLYTLLGFNVLLWLCLDRKELPWTIPVVFLIWTNLHSGFFFGILVLTLFVAERYFLREDFKRAFQILGVSVCLGLLNPYWYKVFLFPLKYAFDRDSPFLTLGEWKPPFDPGGIQAPLYPYAIAAFVLAALIVLCSSSYRKKHGWPVTRILICLLTLAMSLKSRRFIVLFAMSQSLVVSPVLAHLLYKYINKIPKLVPAAIATLLGIWLLYPYPQAGYAFHYLTAEDTFPIETVNFIETNGIYGNVFAYYNWGGYLHLRTQGRLKVYIDGRADTVFDAKTYNNYRRVLSMRPGWRKIIESSGAQYVLWTKNKPRQIVELEKSGRWQTIYHDSVSVLLARADYEVPSQFLPTPTSAYKEYALAARSLASNRISEAEEHLRKTLRLKPYLRPACLTQVLLHIRQGNITAAMETKEKCQAIYPHRDNVSSIEKLFPLKSLSAL